jgi:peptidase E
MGGGGFSMEPDNLALDRYILDQTGKPHPKVCFLPTAGAESYEYTVKFYSALTRLGAEPSHLSLFRLPTADLRGFILEKDVIYVGGGNTRSLLALWREWGLDDILREAWLNGTVLAGLSAGAICWFEQGVTDSVPGQLSSLPCLGYLPGSACPHYHSEPDRQLDTHRLLLTGKIKPGFGIDNSTALHFTGGKLKQVVRSTDNTNACYYYLNEGKVIEEVLPAVDLPACKP